MTKNKLLLIGIVIIGLSLFSFFYKGTNTENTLVEEMNQETIADQWQDPTEDSILVPEITKEQWTIHTEAMMPGLKWARKLKLTETVDEKWMINGTDQTLKIEEIWHTHDTVNIFFSIGINEEINQEYNRPEWYFSLNGSNDEVWRINTAYGHSNWHNEADRLIDGRYYSLVSFPATQDLNQELQEREELVFTEMDVTVNGNRYELSDQTVYVGYRRDALEQLTIEINETIKVDEYQFHIETLHIGPAYSYVTLSNPSTEIESVEFELVSSEFSSSTHFNYYNNNAHVSFAPFDEQPQDLKLNILSMAVMSNKQIEINLPIKSMDESSQSLMLDPIDIDGQIKANVSIAPPGGNVLKWGIKFENTSGKTSGKNFKAVPFHIASTYFEEELRQPNLLSFSNLEGEQLELDFNEISGDNHTMTFLMNVGSIEEEEVKVTIENLLYEVPVNKSIEFDLPEKKNE